MSLIESFPLVPLDQPNLNARSSIGAYSISNNTINIFCEILRNSSLTKTSRYLRKPKINEQQEISPYFRFHPFP